jgi:hypothetical protein
VVSRKSKRLFLSYPRDLSAPQNKNGMMPEAPSHLHPDGENLRTGVQEAEERVKGRGTVKIEHIEE